MSKSKRLATAEVHLSKDKKQFFVSVRKNKKPIFTTETYKNHSYAMKVANWIKGDRDDIIVIDKAPRLVKGAKGSITVIDKSKK